MDKLFKIKENGSKVSTEIIAGLTTFFAMAYILVVNPAILGNVIVDDAGAPLTGAIFLATILASAAGTLVMGLVANVPYAQAPGMGLNAFFTYYVCGVLGFNWQQALAMVFICGIINVIITVTKIRKAIIKSIPPILQHAIGGGIGVFIAYIGLVDAKLVNFGAGVPAMPVLNNINLNLAVIGIFITVILLILKVKGAILLGIIATTAIGIPMGVVDIGSANISIDAIGNSFSQLGQTFGAAFGEKGMGSLFDSRIIVVIITIFAFSLTDTFDTIGTFIGTGRKTGIFSDDDMAALSSKKGFKSKMEKALFADSIATSIGAVFGTSNTTTYVESAAGISAGGKTGLTSVVTAAMFGVSILLAPFIGLVPFEATAPALVAVGIMMMSSFKEINWENLEDAIPAFFAAIFMGLTYSISIGIGTAFIFYCLIKILKGKVKEIHPVLGGATLMFILYFVSQAIKFE